MKTSKELESTTISCDFKKFKGNTFEKSIDIINGFYFGIGLKITETPFIYWNEEDNKNYISAICLFIGPVSTNSTIKSEMICYPHSFLHPVFFHNNLLFYLNPQNNLLVFKFTKNIITKYVFSPNDQKKTIKPKEIKTNKFGEILEQLNKVYQATKLEEKYKILY